MSCLGRVSIGWYVGRTHRYCLKLAISAIGIVERAPQTAVNGVATGLTLIRCGTFHVVAPTLVSTCPHDCRGQKTSIRGSALGAEEPVMELQLGCSLHALRRLCLDSGTQQTDASGQHDIIIRRIITAQADFQRTATVLGPPFSHTPPTLA